MPAVATAQKPTHKEPRQVTHRKTHLKGTVVSIVVPKASWCRPGEFEGQRFIQFARPVHGGLVNIFVKSDRPEQYSGKELSAEVEVIEKFFDDGKSYLLVDLVPSKAAATHRLIINNGLPLKASEGTSVFDCPAPLKGQVVIKQL